MAKTNVIFRRIGGRLVPIKIKSFMPEGVVRSTTGLGERHVVARIMTTGTDIGRAVFTWDSQKRLIKGGKLTVPRTVKIQSIEVRPGMRRQGIGREIFDYSAKLFGRAGTTSIRAGTPVFSTGTLKILNRHKTRYAAMSTEIHQGKRMVSKVKAAQEVAKHELNQPSYDYVYSVTKLKKLRKK